jgi:hypothetical protein
MALFSCSRSADSGKVVTLDSYDSISVSIDYPLLNSYTKLSACEFQGAPFVGGYNHLTHSFDFISLSDSDNFSVSLDQEGADGVLPATGFCFTPSCIVLEDQSGIEVVSYQGKVINRIPRSSMDTDKYSMKPTGVSMGGLVNLSATERKVAIPLFPVNVSSENCSTYSIGMEYDLSDNKLSSIPIKYPSRIVSQIEGLQGLVFSGVSVYADKILYNFPCSSYIYVYDREKNVTDSIHMASVDIPSELSPLDANARKNPRKKFEFESLSSRYCEPHYDSTSGKYFRIHYGPKSDMFQKDRLVGMVVMDSDGRSKREYRFPNNFSEQYFVMGGTIYIQLKDSSDDNSIRFARLKIKDL